MELNKEDILSILTNCTAINSAEADELRNILDKYPYFQPLYFILLRHYKGKNDIQYSNLLKKAIIHVSNRKHLFKYINLPEVETTQTEKPIEPVEIETAEPSIRKEEKEFLSDAIAEAVSQQASEKTEAGFEQRLLPEITFELDESIEIVRPDDAATIDFAIDNNISTSADIDQSVLIIDEEQQIKEDADDIELDTPNEKTDISVEKTNPEVADHKNDSSENIALDIEDPNVDAIEPFENTESKPDLIDKFLADIPKIKPKPVEDFVEYDISATSVDEHDDFMTETLAKIFVRQKNYQKAIDTYSKLSLKFPEKSTYFANQIFEIKKLMNNK